MVSHDRDGNVLLFAWSDGGNSVMTSFPADIRRGVGLPGLGLNSAVRGRDQFRLSGAIGAEGLPGDRLYLLVLENWPQGQRYRDRRDYDGRRRLRVHSRRLGLGTDPDQKPYYLVRRRAGGPYIAVFSDDLSRARFVSAIPGVEAAQVNNNHPWAVVAGKQNGKPRALFLAGATKEANVYGRVSPTPIKNALQSTFGGGESDGYLVLVDLAKVRDRRSRRNPGRPLRIG